MKVRFVKIFWDLFVRDDLRPVKSRQEHLLRASFLMKVYPKQGPGCLVVNASASAVNPKTHRKWVRTFINTMADLVDVMVSKITM
jgi:hypothetical protein